MTVTGDGQSKGVNMMEYGKFDGKLVRQVLGAKTQFIIGDMACVYGALLAGCRFYAGYPITPASELAEGSARLMPKIGGTYIQMEDEIGSIAAAIGASWTGVRSMTGTSGPGFSLMMENLGYAVMTETPVVIINIQRTGPSTGQPTLGAQGDMMQAKWGSHGDYEIIALAPSSVQECLNLTVDAFNLAEKYRNPVLVMADGEIGHLRERIVVPDEKDMQVQFRTLVKVPKDKYVPFVPSVANPGSNVPDFAPFGSGYHTYVTGLTHNEKGMPATDKQPDHDKLIRRIVSKITGNMDKLLRVEELMLDDADVAVVCYGATARPAQTAIEDARAMGIKVGMARMLITWPFPYAYFEKLAGKVKAMLVPEMNLGQMVHPIREAAGGQCKVQPLGKIGGEMHLPSEILMGIKGMM
jgi:2-oxoglutarate ferredoxin oxidoreductase subunit alpha